MGSFLTLRWWSRSIGASSGRMNPTDLKDYATAVTALCGVAGGLLGLFKYFQYKTRRDKILSVGEAFNAVVKSLASEVEVERIAGAIRLRRFFDPETELGIAGTPYADDAVNVMAGVLRTQRPGTLQKLLADGLAYAPSLRRADLQRTNLQNAYLGVRKTGRQVDLSHADFYRADLSGASLKGAHAPHAVFYQARLNATVLSKADLSDANFFEADLAGATFTGAVLARSDFAHARNVPGEIVERLDERGRFPDDEAPLPPASHGPPPRRPRVFLSKPGTLDERQRQLIDQVRRMIDEQELTCDTIERSEYPKFGVIAEVRRLMGGCSGAVIFGLSQLDVREGTWRSNTPEEARVAGVKLPTPWNQIEAGMAAMRNLPVLLVCQPGVTGGILDLGGGDDLVFRLDSGETPGGLPGGEAFANWCAAVRERARAA
jgi:hypothetical protein